jgi:hypothetical protein
VAFEGTLKNNFSEPTDPNTIITTLLKQITCLTSLEHISKSLNQCLRDYGFTFSYLAEYEKIKIVFTSKPRSPVKLVHEKRAQENLGELSFQCTKNECGFFQNFKTKIATFTFLLFLLFLQKKLRLQGFRYFYMHADAKQIAMFVKVISCGKTIMRKKITFYNLEKCLFRSNLVIFHWCFIFEVLNFYYTFNFNQILCSAVIEGKRSHPQKLYV